MDDSGQLGCLAAFLACVLAFGGGCACGEHRVHCEAVQRGAASWQAEADGGTTFKWNASLDSKSPEFVGPPRDWYEDQMRLKALWERQQEDQ